MKLKESSPQIHRRITKYCWKSSYLEPRVVLISLAIGIELLLPRKSYGQRSLVGCSPWGREESDMTERLHFHFSLSCIGEGNGNPLQCSCLENPRDGGAWWAAICGVAQSRTWLERLSRSRGSSWSLSSLRMLHGDRDWEMQNVFRETMYPVKS